MSKMENLIALLSDHFKVSDIGVTWPLCSDIVKNQRYFRVHKVLPKL